MDERKLLHAHLFITSLLLVLCGTWMASIPYGALNFVYDETGRTFRFQVAEVLVSTRWFGLLLLACFVIVVVVGYWREWSSQRLLKTCWTTMFITLAWFTVCMAFLWPAMKVVVEGGLMVFQ